MLWESNFYSVGNRESKVTFWSLVLGQVFSSLEAGCRVAWVGLWSWVSSEGATSLVWERWQGPELGQHQRGWRRMEGMRVTKKWWWRPTLELIEMIGFLLSLLNAGYWSQGRAHSLGICVPSRTESLAQRENKTKDTPSLHPAPRNQPRGTSEELTGKIQTKLQQEKHSWLSWDSDQRTKRKNLDWKAVCI